MIPMRLPDNAAIFEAEFWRNDSDRKQPQSLYSLPGPIIYSPNRAILSSLGPSVFRLSCHRLRVQRTVKQRGGRAKNLATGELNEANANQSGSEHGSVQITAYLIRLPKDLGSISGNRPPYELNRAQPRHPGRSDFERVWRRQMS